MSVLDADHFGNDGAARKLIEGLRWPNGPVCHHCGETQRRYPTKREGRFRCGNPECRKDFTATTWTVMESSKVALHKWLTAFYLMCASKKGVSSHQIHRTLGVTYKTAWFMTHRIREAMREGGLVPPMGGEGGVVKPISARQAPRRNSTRAACPSPSQARPVRLANVRSSRSLSAASILPCRRGR
jgi:transposase-like protein